MVLDIYFRFVEKAQALFLVLLEVPALGMDSAECNPVLTSISKQFSKHQQKNLAILGPPGNTIIKATLFCSVLFSKM